jgi:N-acetylglucosamine malate deacetylase 2
MMNRQRNGHAMLFVCILGIAFTAVAQTGIGERPASLHERPRVLIVVAHPDDESCFAATVYEITHNLSGTADQLVITNGEGGYRYSLLAEDYYKISLTNEAAGRAALPDIRKRELLNAGKILGISQHFFLDEKDVRYTQDIDEVLNRHWTAGVVVPAIVRQLQRGSYDFIFTLFPTADTHGAHKAAALSAIDAAMKMNGSKPVVLGCQDSSAKDSAPLDWTGFVSSEHSFRVAAKKYSLDRTVKFGFNNVLDYQIVVNWVIAEHKSQGAFQIAMNRYDKEEFAILDTQTPSAMEKADGLFRHLSETAAHPCAALGANTQYRP